MLPEYNYNAQGKQMLKILFHLKILFSHLLCSVILYLNLQQKFDIFIFWNVIIKRTENLLFVFIKKNVKCVFYYKKKKKFLD